MILETTGKDAQEFDQKFKRISAIVLDNWICDHGHLMASVYVI